MNAKAIISVLMFSKAGGTKLETATNVLNELHDMKANKDLPCLAIRRAIKIQEKLIKEL